MVIWLMQQQSQNVYTHVSSVMSCSALFDFLEDNSGRQHHDDVYSSKPLSVFYPFLAVEHLCMKDCQDCCDWAEPWLNSAVDSVKFLKMKLYCFLLVCKSCLVRHIELVNRCPSCNSLIHESQPLYNIRWDR